MKFLLLADALDTQQAGIHRYVNQLYNHLSEDWHFIREKRGEHNDREVVIRLRRWPGYALYRKFIEIPKFVNQTHPIAVIEPAHYGPFFIKKTIFRITVIHDLTPLLFPEYHPWKRVWMHRLFMRNILQKADLILTVSQATSKDIVRLFPFTSDRIAITPLAADEYFSRGPSPFVSNYFLFAGTLEPRKNLHVLLKAFEQVRRAGLNLQLRLAGKTGWKSQHIIHAIKNHPFGADIIQMDYTSKKTLKNLYRGAIALIMPSHYEGFGLPILEAMQSGCPCILARNSSLTETGGNAALYFPTSDANALAQRMMELFHSEERRSECIALGLKQAARYDWKSTARLTEQLVHNLISR